MVNWIVTVTDEGAALIASVIASQGTLTITEARMSDEDYYGEEAALTEATFDGVYKTTPVSASIIDLTNIKMEARFYLSGLTEAHEIATVGFIANDGGSDVLLAVLTTEDTPDTAEPGININGGWIDFSISLAVSSTQDITVVGTTAGIQYQELTTPLTINGNTESTVEDALDGLNNYGDALAGNLAANENVYGAKNLSNQTFTSQTIGGVSHTPNADGSLTVTTNGASTSAVVANIISTAFIVKKGTYIFSFAKDSDDPTTSPYSIIVRDSSNTYVCSSTETKAQRTVTFAQDTTIHYECYCGANNVVSDVTFYPMIRDARILDPTFAPFAKTNKQLTDALDYSGTYIFNGTPAYEGYGGIIVPASLPIPANLLSEYSITVTEMSIGIRNGANISLTIDSRDKFEKNHGGVQAIYTLQNYFGTASPVFADFAALRDAYASILVKLTVAHT